MEKFGENILLIDWLSVTFKTSDVPFDMLLYGLGIDKDFLQFSEKAERSYCCKWWHDGVNIHLPDWSFTPFERRNEFYKPKQDTYLLEVSGRGCRTLESSDRWSWVGWLAFCRKFGKITRLDIAFDERSGILDIMELFSDTVISPSFVSKSSKHSVEYTFNEKLGYPEVTIYHGSQSSDSLLRIYDKAAERGFNPLEVHWVRVELQLRHDNAINFVNKFLDAGGTYDIGPFFAGVLRNTVKYVEPIASDSNKWRWPLKPYWASLIGEVEPIKLFSKKSREYNLSNLQNYIFGQCGNSLRAFIQIYGVQRFLDLLRDSAGPFPFGNYEDLINEIRYSDLTIPDWSV